MSFDRLVRFVPKGEPGAILIGEPVDGTVDVGAAVRKGNEVRVAVYNGVSVLEAGSRTDRIEAIDRILSPLTMAEVGTIRCIGLNYKEHAAEANLPVTPIPTIFLKPATALADPWPAPTLIPKHTLASDSADYESELAVVIGRAAKNIRDDEDPLAYVLGYTAANDISSRAAQFAQTQWCYSKGFDGSCPLGPTIVSTRAVPDPARLTMRGLMNGKVMQQSGLDDMVFDVANLVRFCSQGTTLPPGTVIITGTPSGIGAMRNPKAFLHEGDEFVVEILPHIGSLYNVLENEK